MKVNIIAEAGVNHNGDLETAFKLIKAAKKTGADYIKFQTFKASNVAVESAPQAKYQEMGMFDLLNSSLLKDTPIAIFYNDKNKDIKVYDLAKQISQLITGTIDKEQQTNLENHEELKFLEKPLKDVKMYIEMYLLDDLGLFKQTMLAF